MKFHITIPVRNAEDKISRTIQSLLDQRAVLSGGADLKILVCDGESTDATIAAAKAFNDPRIEIRSRADKSMYDALADGLASSTGGICSYLPAGERFEPGAFDVVGEVFSRYPDINWVTGQAITRNADLQVIDAFLPHPYKRRYIDCGMYGTRLPVIQQESTFWRSGLNALIDLNQLRECKLAGDYMIWRSFAAHHEIYVVDSALGSFTIEPDQLSQQHPGAYRRELKQIRRSPKIMELLGAAIHRQRTRRRRPAVTAARTVRFNLQRGEWLLSDARP